MCRTRSLPHRAPFVWAAFWSALQYLGIVSLITSLILFFLNPSIRAMQVIVASLAFTGVTWLIAFFRRRAAFCPLCRGTPLINSGARAHARAVRLRPLSHGVTATLSILATHKFCCMYCGTRYDLLKPRVRYERKAAADQESLN